ncbi:hypothetical protein EII26_11900 [Fretibacterium sp. OH1220_COT-178]|nr:hypothetical protein EII26_11900 [Fretibacterium sp. OH1220_COT-178]
MMKKKISACALLFAVFLLAVPAGAATFTVSNDADKGPGSLRQAILDANSTPEADEIHIDAAVKVITFASEVNISDSLTLNGGGATLKGNTTRLFSITGGTVKFDRLSFTKGKAFSGNGGAVNIEGAAKADFVNCTFFDNDAGASGGAVCVSSSGFDATTFLNCTIADNSATNGGGVAVVRGGVSFAGSIVTGNTQRGGMPQGTDVYAETGGSIFNNGRYNVIGQTNAPGSFSSAWGNHISVSSQDVFHTQPLALTAINGVQVLKLSSLSGNVARDLIPTSTPGFPEIDERGERRPQLLGLDSGAFELSPVPLASIDLKGSPYIQLGKSEQYVAGVHPSDATRDVRTHKDGIEWSVSDTSILSVDAAGIVTALKSGDAVLYARGHGWDASGNPVVSSPASIKIRVGSSPLPVPEVILKPLGDVALRQGTTRTLTPAVTISLAGAPADLAYKLSVSSLNTAVASVDVSPDGKQIVLAGKTIGTSQISVIATASNSAGSSSDTKTFTLTVSQQGSGKSGGGGCNAGFAGLGLLAAAFWALRRKVR